MKYKFNKKMKEKHIEFLIRFHKPTSRRLYTLCNCGVGKGVHIIWVKNMSKKLLVSNSIMWAAAILVVAIVEEKQFAILMLVILATTSLMFLKKGNEQQK